MYLDYSVEIPDVKGKITFRSKGNARYVYYEYSRNYDPSKQYTTVKRVTIGKSWPLIWCEALLTEHPCMIE